MNKNSFLQNISECLYLNIKKVKMSSNLISDFNIDSLEFTELISILEGEYDMRIPDKELDKIKTIKDLYNKVKKYRGL